MAFHGDLSSYPLPDLLQWLDASRKTGALSVTCEGVDRTLYLEAGQLVATAAPGLWERLSRLVEQGGEARGVGVLAQLQRAQPLPVEVDAAVRQLAEEELLGNLLDLTRAAGGAFHWTEDVDRSGAEWVALEVSLRHLLFEALRRLDEVGDVERALPHEQLVLLPRPSSRAPHALHRAVLAVTARDTAVTLGRVRLTLGLSRAVVARAAFELLRSGRAQLAGDVPLAVDPVADMLEKGAVLVRERQFDAAAMVFAALLQNDPGDRRVREFARLVEREHVAALYRELPPIARFEIDPGAPPLASLRPEERTLVQWFQSGWDLSAVVLASPLRELDTLRAIMRLVRAGVLRSP